MILISSKAFPNYPNDGAVLTYAVEKYIYFISILLEYVILLVVTVKRLL